MSLFAASLNSGSNGNCYYVGNQDEAVLIDGGISCRETERRMRRLGLSLKKVKGIFVTHEHSDHIYGVSQLSKKYQLPVYITAATLENGRLKLKEHLTLSFRAYEPVQIGDLRVTAFPKLHDASDPHSFIIDNSSVTVGVFTDIGLANAHLVREFEKCHAAFLESNYDEVLLETGKYPLYLKNRIRDGHGHLSNKQAMQLFVEHRPQFMSHLFLSHLSKNNNSTRIVQSLFDKIAGPTEIIIASRYKETKLYHIRNIPDLAGRILKPSVQSPIQLSLFQGAAIAQEK
jgi:phosphoribosyl 1,2-cyclic phosphodiesterase